MIASKPLDLEAVEQVIKVAEQNNERGSGPICEAARAMLAELRSTRAKDRETLAHMASRRVPAGSSTSDISLVVQMCRRILEEVDRG